MSSATLTTMDAVAKQLYKAKNYNEVTYTNRPLLATLPKFEGFGGRNMPIVLRYTNPSGTTNTFATAQSNRAPSKYDDFLLTRKKVYSVATIDGEAADTLESEEETFVAAMKAEIDGALMSSADVIETQLFRSATGSLGTVGSVSSASLTLSSKHDVTNYEVGMTLRVSATDGASHRTGSEAIGAINRNTGVLTSAEATWATGISAIQAGDYIYISGSLNSAINGLESWMPATAPTTGDSFFGVDRSLDTRLMGNRYDGSSTGESIEEILIEAQGMASREGGKPDKVFMNNYDFRKLIKSTSSRVQYPRGNVSAQNADGPVASIAFKSLIIQGDYGEMEVMPAPKCPQGVAWVLQMDTWSLNSKGKVPKILMRDGLRVMRQSSDDGYEVRVGAYLNLSCSAPSYNCRAALPAAT